MSESSVIKQNNGICVTADTNFASKLTCEEFLRDVLNILKSHPEIADLVSAESYSSYETNILPVPLKNLSQISSEISTNKQNYADERAEFEVRKYVAKFFDPSDPNSSDFYSSYVKPIVDAVKKDFSNLQGGRNTFILSQLSFMRLSQTMVNILLMKKPDGTNNIIRRAKPKPNSRVVDENGNVSYSYYSNEEITNAEMELYNEYNAHNFISLDVGHVPFTSDYLFLSAVSLISVERTERNNSLPIDELTVEEIFEIDENTSISLAEGFRAVSAIAKRDLDIINIVEERGGSILQIIHNDYNENDNNLNESNNENLSMKEKYMTFLLYIRVLLTLAEGLISRIKVMSKHPDMFTPMKVVGIEDNEESYLNELNNILNNPDFIEFFKTIPFKFRISEHLFMVLLVNLITNATNSYGPSAKKIIDLFSKHVGYRKPTMFVNLISNFFRSIDGIIEERAVENVSGLISLIEGRKEPMVSYAYRTLSKYMNNEGKFGGELAIIDSTIKIIDHKISNKRGPIPQSYSFANKNFIFSVDSLVDTVSKLMDLSNLNDSVSPFNNYKVELEKKQFELEGRRKEVSDKIDETYGKSFPKHYIKLPPIPYSISEKVWAKEKCVKLEAEISQITKFNPNFDWGLLRNKFRQLTKITGEFSISEYETPEVVLEIQELQASYDDLCSKCGLDDSYFNKFKILEESLRFYENVDDIKFEFIPFVFKFKKGIENTMTYHIGKTYILHEGVLRKVENVVMNVDGLKILKEYFMPFFLPFATVNVDTFDINFDVSYNENIKNRADQVGVKTVDVVMTVTYGSSDDTHVASKFRTIFPCILDTRRMIAEAKKEMEIPDSTIDFQISDIADKFNIRWARSTEQRLALSGSKGENVFKLISETRGCDESYPFYDNNGMRIVRTHFDFYTKKYQETIELKKRREEAAKKRKELEERKRLGLDDEPKLAFGEESKESREIRESNASRWAAKDLFGKSVDLTNSMNSIVDNKPKQTIRPTTNTRKFNDFRRYEQTQSNRVGNLEIRNNQPEMVAIQNFVKEKVVKVLGPDGYFTYERKKIVGTVRSKVAERPRERNAGITPKRFGHGLRNNNENRNTTPNRRGRNFTPGNRTSTPNRRGTPNSSGSTPTFQPRQRNSVSPSASKRSGPHQGAQSPYESSYLQPDHSVFINAQSGGIGFYPTSAISPIANEGRQIFQDVEVPTGVFIAPNRTPTNDGTDRSIGSATASIALTSTPQLFEDVNDDYDL